MSVMRILLGGMLALTLVGCAISPTAHYSPEVRAIIAHRDRDVDISAVRARYDNHMRAAATPTKSTSTRDNVGEAMLRVVATISRIDRSTASLLLMDCPLDEHTYQCLEQRYNTLCDSNSSHLYSLDGNYTEFAQRYLMDISAVDQKKLSTIRYDDNYSALRRLYIKRCEADTNRRTIFAARQVDDLLRKHADRQEMEAKYGITPR